MNKIRSIDVANTRREIGDGKVQMRHLKGPAPTDSMAHLTVSRGDHDETQALVLATLISTAQASPFPGNGDPVELPALSTYADQFATDRARHTASSIE